MIIAELMFDNDVWMVDLRIEYADKYNIEVISLAWMNIELLFWYLFGSKKLVVALIC